MKKENILRTIIIGVLLITLVGNIPSKRLIKEYEVKTNTTNLKSGYKMTLFDSPDTPVEEKKKNDVENPKTGLDDYVPYAIGGILIIGAITIIIKNKTKVYKI